MEQSVSQSQSQPQAQPHSQKRKQRWTEPEKEVLVSEIEAHQAKLFGKFSHCVTEADKSTLWSDIVDKINAVSNTVRTKKDVMNKRTDWWSETKKKAAKNVQEARKTGGGESSAITLTPLEERILGMMREVAYKGVAGGAECQAILQHLSQGAVTSQPAESQEEPATAAEPSTQPDIPEKDGEARIPKKRAADVTMDLLSTEQDIAVKLGRLVDIQEQLLEVEKCKLDLLKRIAATKDCDTLCFECV